MVDKHAVAVVKDSVVVGHIPYNLAPCVGQFLRRDENKAFAEVTGEVVNRGAGYGQEVPCIYRLYGPKIYIDKMEELVDGMFADELFTVISCIMYYCPLSEAGFYGQ